MLLQKQNKIKLNPPLYYALQINGRYLSNTCPV